MNIVDTLKNAFPGIGIEGKVDPLPDPAGPGNNPHDPTPPADPPPAKFNPVTGEPIKEPDPTSGDPKDPLANYADLFDNKKLEGNTPAATPTAQDILTPDNLGKIMETLPDFTTYISEETGAALASGEDPKAMFKAFDEITKGSYQTALKHSVNLSEKLVEARMAGLEERFSDRINQHNVDQSIKQNEAIANSPVLQAGITILADRLRATNPTASPEWITGEATKFFIESAAVLSGQKPGNTDGGGNPGDPGPADGDGTNWVEFLNNGQPGDGEP